MHQLSFAENLAVKAEDFPAFQGFKLLQLKTQICEILAQFGRNGLFDEYTKHDIVHIDEMLKIYKWLIPYDTKVHMSPADWLLLVCATYLHDVGLVVTRDEYENRARSAYPDYRARALRTNDSGGKDYKAYLQSLNGDQLDKFLYQEFVRDNHASRIRSWLTDTPDESLGFDPRLGAELKSLLGDLEPVFVNDLGLVCESHHKDDLQDVGKYNMSRPYGNSDDETANVQYVSICLRAADLLHITKERTPSIAWKLINPNNPKSQEEWAKQQAVRRVRPQQGKNREDLPDPQAPQDTIEIHAEFDDPEGFFGLIGYLSVAEKELQQCHNWATSSRKHGSTMDFPWRYIDKTHVHATGFMSNKFQFTFDEGKILELLTGHTLYNDSTVVVRETLQNSLDAVRLQSISDNCNCLPEVQVKWTTKDQTLEVIDNGTGMTQEIIEQNFLRVGSSRYQESTFRKEYPTFSPISRFGIGVLSTFMVSDEVQVITAALEEDAAREISLRSVTGEYLIRMLNKTDSGVPELLKVHGHGTLMRIRVRRSADLPDVLAVLKRWLVLPRAKVTFTKDGEDPINIGFSELSTALYATLRSLEDVQESDGQLRTRWGDSIEIRSVQSEGIEVAYAITFNSYFQEWSFWEPVELDAEYQARTVSPEVHLGICIEGIRVESGSPGLPGGQVAAIANASGESSPRTNVARTALEQTPELDNLLLKLYQAYCSHLTSEAQRIMRNRGFSATKASSHVQYLVNPLDSAPMRLNSGAWSHRLLWDAFRQVPAYVSEDAHSRNIISLDEINELESFKTYDSDMIRRVESLLTTLPGTITLTDIARLGKSDQINRISSSDLRLSPNNTGVFDRMLRDSWEPEVIEAYEDGLLSVTWGKMAGRWLSENSSSFRRQAKKFQTLRTHARQSSDRLMRNLFIYLPRESASVVGLDDYDAVMIKRHCYVLPHCQLRRSISSIPSLSQVEQDIILCSIIKYLLPAEPGRSSARRHESLRGMESVEDAHRLRILDAISPDLKEFLSYTLRVFDISKNNRYDLL